MTEATDDDDDVSAEVDPEDVEADTDLDNDISIADEAEEEAPLFDDGTPPRDRKLQTNPFDFIVSSINSQIDDKSIILQDQFQRRRVWNDIKASRLIESLILNVPIPVCYFAEIESGAYAVVDGQQRLTSIYRYLGNEFPLRALKIRPDINRKRFHQLPPSDQRLIKNRAIRCIVILKESHPDIRFDVFERLNTATVSLNRQELRNSNYRGSLNKLIVVLCDNGTLLAIRRAKTSDKRMKDAELILRFLAFHFGANLFKSQFTRHLDNYLELGRNFSDQQISEHQIAFETTITKVSSVFGDAAFRRADPKGQPESQINSAIFDALMLTFAHVDADLLKANAAAVRKTYVEICNKDRDFIDAISRATRDTSRLNTRLERWRQALATCGIACPPIVFGKPDDGVSVV